LQSFPRTQERARDTSVNPPPEPASFTERRRRLDFRGMHIAEIGGKAFFVGRSLFP